MRRHTLSALILPAALAAAAGAQTAPERLHGLFDDHFRWRMEEFPEWAMSRGDYSNADRLGDVSLDAIERRHRQTIAFLGQLHEIDRSQLAERDRISYDLFALQLGNSISGHRFRTFLAPIGGRFGPHQSIPQMAERVRFASATDYENYLIRLEQVPKRIDDLVERMRLGVAEGRTPPRVTLLGVPGQFESLLKPDGLDALDAPFDRFPEHVAPDEQVELRRRYDEVSRPAVQAALARLGRYVSEDYVPGCREGIAATNWPDGAAYYEHQLRVMTTTDLTARQIHEIGLEEVARIRAEMLNVIRASDFMTLHPDTSALDDAALFRAFVQYLRTDPRFYCRDEDELLRRYRDICKRVDAWMPKFFATLPRLSYGVRKIPDFMAPSQTTAYYSPGDIRNAEPGYFYANTYALDQRPTYEMIALAMHEAVPGHHHQIALAQEMEALPAFRRDAYFTAFGEGWALYTERLGLEMGLYEDP
ncbi:MAG: DUF885 domain-containing protein, partial [Planctomycetota bacterium]